MATIPGAPRTRALGWVRPSGIFLTVHPVLARFMPDWLAWTGKGRRVRSVSVKPDGAGLAERVTWMNAGQLRPAVHAAYSLLEAPRAQQVLAGGQFRGKMVLTLAA